MGSLNRGSGRFYLQRTSLYIWGRWTLVVSFTNPYRNQRNQQPTVRGELENLASKARLAKTIRKTHTKQKNKNPQSLD